MMSIEPFVILKDLSSRICQGRTQFVSSMRLPNARGENFNHIYIPSSNSGLIKARSEYWVLRDTDSHVTINVKDVAEIGQIVSST